MSGWRQVKPDDHSEVVPLLPIPNRTVKRLSADDSADSRVKVGHCQANIREGPTNTGWAFFAALEALSQLSCRALVQTDRMVQHCRTMKRRTLLALGTTTTILVVAASAGFAVVRPGIVNQRLTEASRAILAAVAGAVLEGSLPTQVGRRATDMTTHLSRLDETVAAFPRHVRDELSELLGILASAPGRRLFAGLQTEWAKAETAEVQAALQSMRLSGIALRQQAYHALRDLTNAAFYAAPDAWPALHYPGPAQV